MRARAALLLALLAAPASAQGDSACPRDVLVAQSQQRLALDRLEQTGSDEAATCRVWRSHVDTMRRVGAVYGRCLTGAERTQRLAQVQDSEREFAAAIKARCGGR